VTVSGAMTPPVTGSESLSYPSGKKQVECSRDSVGNPVQ
jgi:hypothetical protein